MMKSMKNQQGVTLIVSLVILVALTLIGLGSMRDTSTEIVMAGNLREADLTFQAAEAGLKAAEDYIDGTTSPAPFADPLITGLWDQDENDPDYFSNANTWALAFTSNTSLPHVSAQPLYVIKYLGQRAQNQAALINIGGYGTTQPGRIVSNFRATSRGVGVTGNSFRYLQSYYGKEY